MSSVNLNSTKIRLKTVFNNEVYIIYVDSEINFDQLRNEMTSIYKFSTDQEFTMKWLDEEGDPCILSSQIELEEALRLHEINKNNQLTIHVFSDVPAPGKLCQGEDSSIYKRGSNQLRKLYRVNGHMFRTKGFKKQGFCMQCTDRIWGLGLSGFKCIQCKLLVHKKCRELVQTPCATKPTVDNATSSDSQTTSNLKDDIDKSGNAVSVEDQKAIGDEACGVLCKYSIDDFELIKVVGRGSYAKVLMVELKQTKCIYAMKVIKKFSVSHPEASQWVHTEKNVFTIASNHPFLVNLHSCFQSINHLFFVIEFVRGGDLMFLMQWKRRLSEEHAKFYAAEISIALNFLHSKGIMFRDLKLDNVLLDQEGHIKLTDYGICKEGIWIGDTTNTFCGTPNYIAPEVLRREDYGFSVDWWALGVLLYEMLAGVSPFDIDGLSGNPDHNSEDFIFQAILEKTVRIPRSLSVMASSALRGFLNKDPKERLGCHPDTGFHDIVNHRFFKTIDWEKLEKKQVTPPHKPQIMSDRDISNFPPEFTQEPVRLSIDIPHFLTNIDQSKFEGFDYMNPSLMSQKYNEDEIDDYPASHRK